MSEDEMAGGHHQCNEHELGQTLGDGEGQGDLVSCSPLGHKELHTTGRLNNIPIYTHTSLVRDLFCCNFANT